MRRIMITAVVAFGALAACGGGSDGASPATTTTTTITETPYQRYARAAKAFEVNPMTIAESDRVVANTCDNTVSDFEFVAKMDRSLDILTNQAIVVEVYCPERRIQLEQGAVSGGVPKAVLLSQADIQAALAS